MSLAELWEDDRRRWFLGRLLDLFRLAVMYGVILVLSAGPFAILELRRFGCSTSLTEDKDVAISDLSWDYSIVSMVALLLVTLFCVNALPHYPDSWTEFSVAVGTAIIPLLWSPMLIGIVASPTCSDSALLVDAHSTDLTLPSGVTVVTTDESVMDEAGRVMAFGVLLIGIGSSMLTLYLVIDGVICGRPFGRDKLLSFGVMVVALFVYLSGGSAIQDATSLRSNHWANGRVNNARAKHECKSGSSSVFGRTLAASDRDAFNDLNIAVLSLALLSLIVIAVLAVYDRALQGTMSSRVVAVVGFFFAVIHLMVSILVSQAVFVGSNPLCTQATFGGDRDAARAVTAMAYAMALVALYTVVATPAIPLSEASWAAGVGRQTPSTNRPDVSEPEKSPEKSIHNDPPRIVHDVSFDDAEKGDVINPTTTDLDDDGENGGVLVVTDPVVHHADSVDDAAADLAPPAVEEEEEGEAPNERDSWVAE